MCTYVENFPTNHPVKEFWKSVHICQDYCQTSRSVLFFGLSVPIQCQFFSWWWANWNRYPWFFIIVKTVFCNISYTQLSLLLLLLLLYMVVIVTVTVTVFVIIIKRSSICHGTCQSWNDEYSINILLVYVVYKQQIFFRKLINYSTNRFLNWIFFSQI